MIINNTIHIYNGLPIRGIKSNNETIWEKTDSNYVITASKTVTIRQGVNNAYDWSNHDSLVTFAEIENAIGTRTPVLLGLTASGVTTAYGMNPSPGFWFDSNGMVSEWIEGVTPWGMSIANTLSSEGIIFNCIQMPNLSSYGDTYETTLYLANEETHQYMQINLVYNIINPYENCMYFEAKEPSTIKISWIANNFGHEVDLDAKRFKISFDGVNFEDYAHPYTINGVSLNTGDKVYWYSDYSDYAGVFYEFTINGCVEAYGDIQSLNGFSDKVPKYAYYKMFKDCTALTKAPELSATTLSDGCYEHMFDGCTSLTTAPEIPATTVSYDCCYMMFADCTSLTTAPSILPATTLEQSCYCNMFYRCRNLTTAPVLPATELAANCYEFMFSDCTSLTTAPELPATTLAVSCYWGMFYNCYKLTTAPVLPATELVRTCYYAMFENCYKLNYIKAMFTTTPSTDYTNNWLKGVSSTGIFVKNSEATWTDTGTYAIPDGWTVEYADA